MTDPFTHFRWCDPARCAVSPDRPTGTHSSRVIKLGPYPPSPIIGEVSLAQSSAVPGYPASGRPFVALSMGEVGSDDLPMTPLPVEFAALLGRILLEFVRDVSS